jgi:hypothetical protein
MNFRVNFAILHGDREGAEVGVLITDAHPQDDPPLGDEVERDDVLGHVHGVMEREAAGLGRLGLGDDLVDAAIEVLTPRRIGDRAVETEFHGGHSGRDLDTAEAGGLHRHL